MWTEELDATLKTLHEAGLSYRLISDKMGVSRNAIAGRCHRLHLSREGKSAPMKKTKHSRPPVEQTEPIILPAVVPVDTAKGAVEAILSTKWRSCRFPIGDPKKPDFHFCGQPTRIGQPYCPDHYSIVYIKDSRR